METICMGCQIWFSAKNKISISICCLLKILPRVLSTKVCMIKGYLATNIFVIFWVFQYKLNGPQHQKRALIIAPDKDHFSGKKYWYFSCFSLKTKCGYSLEAPLRGPSNEYPQHVFMEKEKYLPRYYSLELCLMTQISLCSLAVWWYCPLCISRVERKTGVSQMVVFPQT